MPVRTAQARWEGDLPQGNGRMSFGGGAFEGQYSYGSRFEEGPGTNPEELIGAAHAGCFSMALAGILGRAGHAPEAVDTTARVHLDKGDAGFSITAIELATEVRAPGLADDDFQRYAADAKENCPVSRALAVEVRVDARLAA